MIFGEAKVKLCYDISLILAIFFFDVDIALDPDLTLYGCILLNMVS